MLPAWQKGERAQQLEKQAQRANVPLAAEGLPVACYAVSYQSSPAKLIEQKNNQAMFKKGVHRVKSLICGQRASEISQILEIELFA